MLIDPDSIVDFLEDIVYSFDDLIQPLYEVVENALRGALERFTSYLWEVREKPGQIIRGPDGSKYLTRTYLTGRGKDGWLLGAFFHHFHRGDHDRALHNHPWDWAIAFILTGGYTAEERQDDDSVAVKSYPPFSINLIRAKDFHRVDLLDPINGCWTLFVRHKRIQDWGFWDRDTKIYLPWREFLGIEEKVESNEVNYDDLIEGDEDED